MFTGIIQGVATIDQLSDKNGIRTLEIEFPQGFCQDLEIGASVAIDGVCLTVTENLSDTRASFDVILQSLSVTTLDSYEQGANVNAERAAKDGAEIGGHPLSGHIDFTATISEIEHLQDNFRMRIAVDKTWMRYIFPKGYIAVNGASLTLATVDKKQGWFEVWLIPETLRMTSIGNKAVGDKLNIEIERGTQVTVDTIRDTIEGNLGRLTPVFERLLQEQGIDLSAIGVNGGISVDPYEDDDEDEYNDEYEDDESFRIEVTDTPSPSIDDYIINETRLYNSEHMESDDLQKISCYFRDRDDCIVGGLTAKIYWGWLHIEYLWVEQRERRQDLGKVLVQSAEQEAENRGCVGSQVDTFSFQAPEFYKKLGYSVMGSLKGYKEGAERFYLYKHFGE